MNNEKHFEIVCLGKINEMSIEDIEDVVNDVIAIKGKDYAVSSGVWTLNGNFYISLSKTNKSYNRFELVKKSQETKK